MIDFNVVCVINKQFCKKTGERFGVLSKDAVLSALSVQNSYYDSDEEIGATLFRSLILNHGFENANKRTASMCLFIYCNPKLRDYELEKLAVDIATGKIKDVEEIRQILFHDFFYEKVNVHKMIDIREKLSRLDSKGFRELDEDFDLEALYESTKAKLSSEDRQKLQKFLQTTDDPEEVNVYMKGLLMEDAEDVQANKVDREYLDVVISAYDELRSALDTLVSEANRFGNDTIRAYADSTLLDLEDVWDRILDIQEEFDLVDNNDSVGTPEDYIQAFKHRFDTKEAFEDSEFLDFNLENVADTIWEWIEDDADGNISYAISKDIAGKAAKELINMY